MKKIKKIFLLIIIIIFIVVGYFIFQYLKNLLFLNAPIEGISEELINTRKEAIEFAKKDVDIITFDKGLSLDYKVSYNAYYEKELGVWQIVVYPDSKYINDFDYQISFTPDGKITFKGPIPI